jgi:hypothetical protein
MERRKAIDSCAGSAVPNGVTDQHDSADPDYEADEQEQNDRAAPASRQDDHEKQKQRAQTGQQQHDPDEDEEGNQTSVETLRPSGWRRR